MNIAAAREAAEFSAYNFVSVPWIPGSRYARPGMTGASSLSLEFVVAAQHIWIAVETLGHAFNLLGIANLH